MMISKSDPLADWPVGRYNWIVSKNRSQQQQQTNNRNGSISSGVWKQLAWINNTLLLQMMRECVQSSSGAVVANFMVRHSSSYGIIIRFVKLLFDTLGQPSTREIFLVHSAAKSERLGCSWQFGFIQSFSIWTATSQIGHQWLDSVITWWIGEIRIIRCVLWFALCPVFFNLIMIIVFKFLILVMMATDSQCLNCLRTAISIVAMLLLQAGNCYHITGVGRLINCFVLFFCFAGSFNSIHCYEIYDPIDQMADESVVTVENHRNHHHQLPASNISIQQHKVSWSRLSIDLDPYWAVMAYISMLMGWWWWWQQWSCYGVVFGLIAFYRLIS